MKKKLTPPPVAEAACYVIRIYERATGKWFSTVTKDAIRSFASKEVDSKAEAVKLAAENIV